nr:zinc ribbon domain-containing protein [uncultured Blautia sp.]
MRKGFFDGLSETLTRTTKDLSKKAGQIYETQKIQSKVSGEEHMIEKLKSDIGNLIYSRYCEGAELDEELQNLCQEIRQHQDAITEYKDAAADLKGRKICPSCKRAVDKDVAFCPFCGTACPNPEPDEEVAAEASAEEVPEEEAPAEETVAEASEEAAEESAPETETPAEDTQE